MGPNSVRLAPIRTHPGLFFRSDDLVHFGSSGTFFRSDSVYFVSPCSSVDIDAALSITVYPFFFRGHFIFAVFAVGPLSEKIIFEILIYSSLVKAESKIRENKIREIRSNAEIR